MKRILYALLVAALLATLAATAVDANDEWWEDDAPATVSSAV